MPNTAEKVVELSVESGFWNVGTRFKERSNATEQGESRGGNYEKCRAPYGDDSCWQARFETLARKFNDSLNRK